MAALHLSCDGQRKLGPLVFLDPAGRDFRDAQVLEERDQVNARPPVLAVYISLVVLPLRLDVVLVQVVGRDFAKGLFGFDLSGAEFPAQLQVPVLGDLHRELIGSDFARIVKIGCRFDVGL